MHEWRGDLVEAFSTMKPPPGSIYARRRVDRESGGKRIAGAFAVLAHHPDLTRAFLSFNRHVLYENTLGERLLELVVLRVAFLRGSQYEWSEHVAVARELGFSDDEIHAAAVGPEAEELSGVDALVLRAVDEIRHDSVFSAETWTGLKEHFDTKQILDPAVHSGRLRHVGRRVQLFRPPSRPRVARFRATRCLRRALPEKRTGSASKENVPKRM